MATPYYNQIPNRLKQSFSRLRRTSGGAVDSYGDATFTEQTTTGFRGNFQIATREGQPIILAGKEIRYDAVVHTSGTMLVGEDDILLFGSSTATTVSTRYHVRGIKQVYDGTRIDHKELYVAQEVI